MINIKIILEKTAKKTSSNKKKNYIHVYASLKIREMLNILLLIITANLCNSHLIRKGIFFSKLLVLYVMYV